MLLLPLLKIVFVDCFYGVDMAELGTGERFRGAALAIF